MAKLTDKLYNRVIEGKLVAESGDELPKELPSVSAIDNGKVLLVSGGKWQAGSVSGGTQLYKHTLDLGGMGERIIFISSVGNRQATLTGLNNLINGTFSCVYGEMTDEYKVISSLSPDPDECDVYYISAISGSPLVLTITKKALTSIPTNDKWTIQQI